MKQEMTGCSEEKNTPKIPHAKGQLLGERTCPGMPDGILL